MVKKISSGTPWFGLSSRGLNLKVHKSLVKIQSCYFMSFNDRFSSILIYVQVNKCMQVILIIWNPWINYVGSLGL